MHTDAHREKQKKYFSMRKNHHFVLSSQNIFIINELRMIIFECQYFHFDPVLH